MLKAQIIGNVGRDPDIERKGDHRYARFSLAANKKVKGEKVTTWVNCTVFGDKRVEFIEGYVRKGAKLFIEGDVQAHYYETRGGDPAASLDVVVGSFDGKLELVSSDDSGGHDDRRSSGRSAGGGSRSNTNNRNTRNNRDDRRSGSPPPSDRGGQQWDEDYDDDIPF